MSENIDKLAQEIRRVDGNHSLGAGALAEALWPYIATLRGASAAEGDDPWRPSGADYDRSIHANPDASAWADFFVATFPGQAAYRDLMLGWFANAMMAMHDGFKARPAAEGAAPQASAKLPPLPPLPRCWTGSPVAVTWAEDGETTTHEVYTAEQVVAYANAYAEAALSLSAPAAAPAPVVVLTNALDMLQGSARDLERGVPNAEQWCNNARERIIQLLAAPTSAATPGADEPDGVMVVRALPTLAYIDGGRVSMSEADFEKLRLAAIANEAKQPEAAHGEQGDGEAARRYIRDWCPDHVKAYIASLSQPAAAPGAMDKVSRLRKYYEVTQHRVGMAKMALMREDVKGASLQLAHLSNEIDAALAQQPPASGSRGVDEAYPTDSDRSVLLYLMQQFDSEWWNCERCGHAEACADMDSARYLREYLATPDASAQEGADNGR